MTRQKICSAANYPLIVFTLVELLVVIAVIMILAGLLLPVLKTSRAQARAKLCMGNLKNIGVALAGYQSTHKGYVVPSYNMVGCYSSTQITFDGWGPILIMENHLNEGGDKAQNNVFHCPETLDLDGWAGGQTGTDPDKPNGYMPWPNFNKVGAPMPGWCERVTRVSYWINAQNPTSSSASTKTRASMTDVYYTTSVGYPCTDGLLPPQKDISFKSPSRLIALSDGMYAGQQSNSQVGNTNRRVGYRHPGGQNKSSNVLCADGHCANIKNEVFPRGNLTVGGTPTEERKQQHSEVSVYADPAAYGL